MYTFNLLIVTILYPILAYYFIPKLTRQRAAILIGLCLALGIVFTFLSTVLGYTFEINLLDTIAINIFLFSIFGLTTWIFHHFANRKKWLHLISLFLSSIIAFILFNNAFGPSEACGQRFPEESQYIDTEHKITHAGYQYGFMDYGSRFIVYRTHFGIEKIIGMAENPNNYYEKGSKVRVDMKNKIVVIDYNDYQNKQKIDTLYIQAED